MSMTRAACGALCALSITLAAGARAADPKPAEAKPPEKKLKVCFIYVGPVGDLGWSHAHDEALPRGVRQLQPLSHGERQRAGLQGRREQEHAVLRAVHRHRETADDATEALQ